jgi:predicted RNase H-like nuclease
MTTIIGVDACRAGWVAVTLGGRVRVHGTFADVVATAPADAVIAVDMPVGLVERGWRAADLAVRDFLGPRRASLFVMPPRPVLAARSHRDACRLAEHATGKRISLQAFHLLAKVREVDPYAGDPRIVEVHPETSFAIMAGAPLAERKQTPAGRAVRARLLASRRIHIADDAGHDTLDAAAAAWSGARWRAGTARDFPELAIDIDRSGRRICIVA